MKLVSANSRSVGTVTTQPIRDARRDIKSAARNVEKNDVREDAVAAVTKRVNMIDVRTGVSVAVTGTATLIANVSGALKS
jgi:hypothetical protein